MYIRLNSQAVVFFKALKISKVPPEFYFYFTTTLIILVAKTESELLCYIKIGHVGLKTVDYFRNSSMYVLNFCHAFCVTIVNYKLFIFIAFL